MAGVMEGFRVRSRGPLSQPLNGTVHVGGAKNSALKLMAAALLAPGRSVITNVPDILDVQVMARLLERLGCTVQVEHPDASDLSVAELSGNLSGTVTIEVPEELGHEAPYDLVRRLRASISVLGPLVARCGRAKVALPGGDNIGSRGLDMHISGLEALGASVRIEHGFVVAEVAQRLTAANLWLDFPSVGATENLVMAAVLTPGTTMIDNVAREPEIIDLCQMLAEMGARIDGISTSTLRVEGVDRLRPVTHATVTDRIVAGTWTFAAAIAGGDLTIAGGRSHHLDIVLDKMSSTGAVVSADGDGFRVRVDKRLGAFDVVTLPYPGFPTDLQPFAMALAAVSEGTAMITENVFEARFMFAQELARLGADLRTDGHHAVVRGKPQLSGAPVVAHDIRAGAALVLAGLAADGTTTVAESHHIDRGYPHFVEVLGGLGVDIGRVEVDDISR
ncbi:MAG TPA: UDP-N-acetylglucosamine 1-carboxyvinyltransferase [Nocardioidaceae bacterium]|nr:UDP-N-acetylglucosamine 1-carboxyvinyltransferase [Nocardioidaceae bacterium]